jgi:hypothetical protein
MPWTLAPSPGTVPPNLEKGLKKLPANLRFCTEAMLSMYRMLIHDVLNTYLQLA